MITVHTLLITGEVFPLRAVGPLYKKFLGAALALATIAGSMIVASPPAQADIIDDLLGVASDFVPYYKYVQQTYDLYEKYLAGQPVVPSVVGAINSAKTQIIHEVDAVAVADVATCTKDVVNTFTSIDLLNPDVLQAFAQSSAHCLNLADSDIVSLSDPASIDQLGLALNTVGPLALIVNQQTGLPVNALTQTLIDGNQRVLTKLAPTCGVSQIGSRVGQVGGPLGASPPTILQGRGYCNAYNYNSTTGKGRGQLPFIVETTNFENINYPSIPITWPAVQDYTIAKNQAMATTSYAVATVALDRMLAGPGNFGSPIAAGLSTSAFADVKAFQVDSNGVVSHDRQSNFNGPFSPWATFDRTPHSAPMKTVAVASNAGGRLEMFALSRLGGIYHRWQVVANDNTTWSDWTQMDGQLTSITIARNQNGELQIFGTNQFGNIWTRSQNMGSDQSPGVRNDDAGHQWDASPAPAGKIAVDNWSPWLQLSGSLSRVAAATDENGEIELFGVNGSGAIFNSRETAPNVSGSWTSWVQLPGAATSIATVNASPTATGGISPLQVFVIGGGGTLWQATQTAATSSFTAWSEASAGPYLSVAATRNAVGLVELFGIDANGQVSVDLSGSFTPIPTTMAGNPVTTPPGNLSTVVGTSTSVTLSATGGTPSYVWSFAGLPPGLSYDGASHIAGTPTTAGTYSVSETLARDSNGVPGNTVTFTWTIRAIVVPNIVGLTLGGAGNALSAVGLKLGNETAVTLSDCADPSIGKVLSQTPAAGTPVAAGSAVNFSLGVKPTGANVCP